MTYKSQKLREQLPCPLVNDEGIITKTFANVIEDIFRKFDIIMGRELSFTEFSQLYLMTGEKLTEEEFRESFLSNYCSTAEGITLRGLIDFFQTSIREKG